jgi:hypothetical protein
MRIKKRTLNELRQTKDSHYVVRSSEPANFNDAFAQDYINKMKEDGRVAQISVANFIHYLTKNNLRIIQE